MKRFVVGLILIVAAALTAQTVASRATLASETVRAISDLGR